MTFSVTIPTSGYSGWLFLKRTQQKQQDLLAKSPARMRDEKYFINKISDIEDAGGLVADRTLLRVALGSSGLSSNEKNYFFIKKVLESDLSNPESLANKLSDKRYLEFAYKFSFLTENLSTDEISNVKKNIILDWRKNNFIEAVGRENSSLRIALYAEQKLPEIAEGSLSDRGKWFAVLGSEPLREFFETIFGLPKSFSAIGIDRQAHIFGEKYRSYFIGNSINDISKDNLLQDIIRKYVIISNSNHNSSALKTGAANALKIIKLSSS